MIPRAFFVCWLACVSFWTRAAEPESGTVFRGPGFESSIGLKFVPVGDVYFATFTVRRQDYELFAKETKLSKSTWRQISFQQGPTHPVVNVSWDDAMAFAQWLTVRDRQEGRLKPDELYRLPTDLEWSQAAGLPVEKGATPEDRDMGVPDLFPWGPQWPPPPNVGNFTGEETKSDVAIRGYNDGFEYTSPVGTFPPNGYGLYDMAGNVWQWCLDDWNGRRNAKVLRGGSWYNGALKLSLLSSCRVSAKADSRTDNYGFRLVKAREEKK